MGLFLLEYWNIGKFYKDVLMIVSMKEFYLGGWELSSISMI